VGRLGGGHGCRLSEARIGRTAFGAEACVLGTTAAASIIASQGCRHWLQPDGGRRRRLPVTRQPEWPGKSRPPDLSQRFHPGPQVNAEDAPAAQFF